MSGDAEGVSANWPLTNKSQAKHTHILGKTHDQSMFESKLVPLGLFP